MLGQYNLLPFLKGWEYKEHILIRTNIVRGAAPTSLRISEQGWLKSIFVLSTDCYGTLKVSWQGADLQTRETYVDAEGALAIGAVAQDPSGWVQKYFRPNPASSAGIFVTVAFSGGAQGSVWPYVPTVIMEISLPSDSTQASAYVAAVAVTIAITNPKLFLQTYRSIMGIKGKLDPGLFVLGPTPLEEKQ